MKHESNKISCQKNEKESFQHLVKEVNIENPFKLQELELLIFKAVRLKDQGAGSKKSKFGQKQFKKGQIVTRKICTGTHFEN